MSTDTMTIQGQVRSIQEMLDRSLQGFEVSRRSVIYGNDEEFDLRPDDLTGIDLFKNELSEFTKRFNEQKLKENGQHPGDGDGAID